MSKDMIFHAMFAYRDQLFNNTKDPNELMEEMRAVFFAEPKVPADNFLEFVRGFDSGFQAITDPSELEKRAELCKKAQDGVLRHAVHQADRSVAGLKIPEGKVLNRGANILIQGRPREERQQILDLWFSGDKKAIGKLIYDRLAPKKDQCMAMLDMDDAELVDHYFKYSEELHLIAELQALRDFCEFTPDQKPVIDELYNNMTRFATLGQRIDMISSPYYTQFPVENIKMSTWDVPTFDSGLSALGVAFGEPEYPSDTNLHSPTEMLGNDFKGMRTFSTGAVVKLIDDYLGKFGLEDASKLLWTDSYGDAVAHDMVGIDIMERKPIFVNIPGVGAKALLNTAKHPADCKLEEMSPEIFQSHMARIAQSGREKTEQANPLFLSLFTGSKQYDTMLKWQREAEKAMQALKVPVQSGRADVNKAIEALSKLEEAHKAYMERKESQGLERDAKGNLVGRSQNEINRLAAARSAERNLQTLKFQLGYLLDPERTAVTMQTREDRRLEALAQKEREEAAAAAKETAKKKPAAAPVQETLTEDEKLKGTKEQMLENNLYAKMPPCKASDAGEALEGFRKEVVSGFQTLAGRANQNRVMSDTLQDGLRFHMAQMVLFDCMLRERAALNGPEADSIQAGPLEKAMAAPKGFMNACLTLSHSAAFKNAIGKVTPARIEAFLNGKEAKGSQFNQLVQETLGMAKPNANVAENQVAQPQAAKAPTAPQIHGV